MYFPAEKARIGAAVVMAGTMVLLGMSVAEGAQQRAHERLSMVDKEPLRRRLGGVSMVTRSARSPIASSFSMASTST